MNFFSIHQYFNKLQIAFLSLMMIPVFAFIAIYFFSLGAGHEPRSDHYIIIPSLAVLDWLFAIIIFNKTIKSARIQQGLGAKLQKYLSITIVRYCFVSSAGLILAVGFFLTMSEVFVVSYFVSVLLSLLVWPTGPRVSRELMLRGDEREMVYFKKDSLL